MITSSWSTIEQLASNSPDFEKEFVQIYLGNSTCCRLEIRQYCSDWIMKQNWKELAENYPLAQKALGEVIDILKQSLGRTNNSLLERAHLRQTIQLLESDENEARQMFASLKDSIEKETDLVRETKAKQEIEAVVMEPPPAVTQAVEGLSHQIAELRGQLEEGGLEVARMEQVLSGVWDLIEKRKLQTRRSMVGLDEPCADPENICREANQLVSEYAERINSVSSAPLRSDMSSLIDKHLHKILVVCPLTKSTIRVPKSVSATTFSFRCKLLGGELLGLDAQPEVYINLRSSADPKSTLIGKVNNGYGLKMNGFQVQPNKLQLAEVKPLGEEPRREDMCHFICSTVVQLGGKPYCIAAASAPAMLYREAKHECTALGYIMWTEAFATTNDPYPNEVKKEKFEAMISALFKKHTEKELPADQLRYLLKQARGQSTSRSKVMRDNVLKNKLDQCTFTFWTWIYANLRLVEEKLKKEWETGLIQGFISKRETEKLLVTKDPGTFLVRFSEHDITNPGGLNTLLGSLRLAVVEVDPKTDKKRVYHFDTGLSPEHLFKSCLCQILESYDVVKEKEGRRLLKNLLNGRSLNEICDDFGVGRTSEGTWEYSKGHHRIKVDLDESSRKPRKPNAASSQRSTSQDSAIQQSTSSRSSTEPISSNDQGACSMDSYSLLSSGQQDCVAMDTSSLLSRGQQQQQPTSFGSAGKMMRVERPYQSPMLSQAALPENTSSLIYSLTSSQTSSQTASHSSSQTPPGSFTPGSNDVMSPLGSFSDAAFSPTHSLTISHCSPTNSQSVFSPEDAFFGDENSDIPVEDAVVEVGLAEGESLAEGGSLPFDDTLLIEHLDNMEVGDIDSYCHGTTQQNTPSSKSS